MGFWTSNTRGHDGNGTIPPHIPSTKSMGTITVVGGTITCDTCGTGNPVAGRPGQTKRNLSIKCRSCPVTTIYGTVNFACNN